MRVLLIPSLTGDPQSQAYQYLTSFLINDTVAIDAGSLGFWNSPEDQARVRHVFLSHSHIDHIASLPIFLENVYASRSPGVTVHASPEVMHCLEQDLFNDRLWPNLVTQNLLDPPLYHRELLAAGRCVAVDGLRITPIPVNHVVPTLSFIVEDTTAAVIFASDTAETDEIWQRANDLPNLKAVFLEVTFPSSYASLADRSKHLTPASFRQEIRKLTRAVPVIVVHIKARFRDPVVQELRALGLSQVEIGESGRTYSFLP